MTLTVKQLKKILESLPDNMKIILQKDSEGNGYSPCDGVDPECVYVPETTYDGEVYSLGYSAEANGFDEKEWKKPHK